MNVSVWQCEKGSSRNGIHQMMLSSVPDFDEDSALKQQQRLLVIAFKVHNELLDIFLSQGFLAEKVL